MSVLLRLVLLLTFFVACSGEVRNGAGYHLDDLGRPVELDGEATRVVSLAPSITEVLFAIGAGDRVVGRTRWDDYPPEALEVPSVGDGLDPNVETIAARDPDLVVFYASSSNDAAISQLSTLGIATASVHTDSLSDIAAAARFLGRLVGAYDRADSVADVFERDLDSLRAESERSRIECEVAIVSWDSPPIIIGAGSFLDEVLRLAGASNVFHDVATPSAEVSIEAIAARDPDAIVVLGEDSSAPEYADRDEWQAVQAVKNRRFIHLSGSELEHPSFRTVAAIESVRPAFSRCGRG